ncbi:MarR family winged helix-turn-helix transcriptional regulator [Catellatospora vulcania]|uniref:MarR family winged helix-turn-helix transcriptional regulator n=1 Tax=Catellatospora vulcania TaxID=1460450 RepID=UPI0012D48FD7|nr:helix-turn-helix domain-containing protein [Catellatospora vulcania]
MSAFDPADLAAVISPLRRTLLAAARAAEDLPEIPDAQIEIIRALPAGSVATPGELAARLGMSRPTVSNLLRTMEHSGLIARRQRDDDRRRVTVAASAKALDLFDRFDRASARLIAAAAATLPDGDRDALAAAVPALDRLRAALAGRRPNPSASPTPEDTP